MLHARYLHTARGMAKVYQKYMSGVYGNCPRVLCERIKALPIGVSDDLRVSRVKVGFIASLSIGSRFFVRNVRKSTCRDTSR